MRRKPKREYEIINIHPTYESEEAREKAMCELCNKLYRIYKKIGMEDLMIVEEDTSEK